jgi:hypothetical protein
MGTGSGTATALNFHTRPRLRGVRAVGNVSDGVRLIGPFTDHRVIVGDRQVPFLTAHEVDGGRVNLIFDNRLAVLLPAAEFESVTTFVSMVIEQCFDPTLGKRFPIVHEITSAVTS